MKIGIIGAMESEVSLLRDELADARSEICCGMEVYEGTLEGVSVAVVRCGIGKVNAALCAQMLILKHGVTHVINTGVAGSLDAAINIGDVVVSTTAVQHDVDVMGLGYQLGAIPGMDTSVFEAEEGLRHALLEAAAAVAPEIRTIEGCVASGDTFVSSKEAKERILAHFDACCCEMEGAAIAHACHLARVPFVIVRAISDKADDSAHMDYRAFEEEAAQRSARIVEYVLAHLQ